MSFLAILVFAGALLASPVNSKALVPRNVTSLSNAKTSLTLLYQNNLNGSDNANHVGALLLDPVSQSDASAACATLNEHLLPSSILSKYKTDFIQALSYQDYAEYVSGSKGFHVANGTVVLERGLRFNTLPGKAERKLPVLCSQSANNGSSSAGPVNGSHVTIASTENTYIGYRNQKSFRFLGIRYADTPQRWKYSSLYSKKGQTIQATSYGAQCAQGSSGSEDCLFLNIQTPYIPKAGSKKNLRPVLFWIHGGGFTGGSGSDSLTDGGNLASREDLVVVTINYRLSTLGFFAIPGTDITGNYGIADQSIALDWVRANIASFGGNPKQITIMGGSAGAGSVRAHLGSPQSIGKFQGAVAVSNLGGGKTLGLNGDYGTTYSTYYTLAESFAVAGSQIFTAAGCNSSRLSSQISCLEQLPAPKLVSLSTVARYVVQDGKYVNTPNLILNASNPNTAHVPVIFGITANDGSSFTTFPKTPVTSHVEGLQVALKINSTWADRIIASNLFPFTSTGNLTLDSFNVSQRITTDKMFRCIDQATVYAGTESGAFAKAFFYQLDRTTGGYDPNNIGPPPNNDPKNPYFRYHGGDLPWVFGNLNRIREPEDLWSVQLSSGYFASFVRSGQPNPDPEYLKVRGYDRTTEGVKQAGTWEAVNGETGPIRALDWPSSEKEFQDVEQCEWLGYGLDYYLEGGA